MTSRRSLTIVAILIWAAVAVTAAPQALSRHRATVAHAATTISMPDIPPGNCSDLGIRFDDREAVYQSEDRTITKSEAPSLHVKAHSNGGLYVEGWDKDTYSVTLCKAAEAGSESLLSQVHMTFNNGELGISGPESSRHWAAFLYVRAPKSANLGLKVQNGPLTLKNVDGTLKVLAENGPVTITGCSGELDLTAENGPVTLEQNSGHQTIHAENGPITVALSGKSWNGAGLEASSTNGPVTLEVPSGYTSGVLLKAQGHSPFQCSASVCSEGRKTWDDDDKMVEFGSGPTIVKVTTVNGPVNVANSL
jgi:hypothetical protein